MKCGVLQGSICGTLLFVMNIDELVKALTLINPIMFVDDRNLLYFNSNIWQLFATMNNELQKIAQCYNATKLTSNIKPKMYLLSKTQK